MKILIVDDSSTMRKIVMRTLRQAGFSGDEVVEAGDGVEGLSKLDEGSVDLIFSDVNMPNMNGMDFIKAIRERDDCSSIPVIMVTTEGGDEAMKGAMELGASGYVVKPFTADQIKEVVERVSS